MSGQSKICVEDYNMIILFLSQLLVWINVLIYFTKFILIQIRL